MRIRVLRVIATLAALAVGILVLHRYDYLTAFGQVDNIVGMLPCALVVTFVAGVIALIWMKHTKPRIPITVTLSVIVVLSLVVFPNALRGNWWINPTTSEAADAAPDLSVYAPFTQGSLTAKLDEDSSLRLADSLPVLDGATALYPVYAAFAEAAYDQSSYTDDRVLCTNTRGSYEAIIAGERDIVFVAGASEKQKALAAEAGVELVFTPIGREAFVFVVGKDNPVENLTDKQLRNIYSGKTAYWGTLDWPEGGRIIAFQRPEGSGSQTGLQTYLGNTPIQVPQPLPDPSLIGTNSLMQQVSVEWNGVQPALGYSYRFYATTMYANPNTKLLSINGVEPTTANIQNGSYPFVGSFYAVTNGEPQGNAKLLIDWILSPQGQRLIEETGYTPIGSTR